MRTVPPVSRPARGWRSRRRRRRGRWTTRMPSSTPRPTVRAVADDRPGEQDRPVADVGVARDDRGGMHDGAPATASGTPRPAARTGRPRVALSPIATTNPSAPTSAAHAAEVGVDARPPACPTTTVAEREVAVEHAHDPCRLHRRSSASITWRPWSEPPIDDACRLMRAPALRQPTERLHRRVPGRRHAVAARTPASRCCPRITGRAATSGGRRTRRRARTSRPTSARCGRSPAPIR